MVSKKKMVTIAVLLLALTMLGYGTIAFFTAEETATNVITAGNVDIELQETAVTEDGKTIMFEESQERFGVMPGEEVSKIVQIVNTGDNEAYVRIGIEKSIKLAEGISGESNTDLITMDFNSDNWTAKDGYYYYNQALAPGTKTEPLFRNVIFNPSMSNMYQGSEAIIKVDAQATQVKNNGATVFEAAGWPQPE